MLSYQQSVDCVTRCFVQQFVEEPTRRKNSLRHSELSLDQRREPIIRTKNTMPIRNIRPIIIITSYSWLIYYNRLTKNSLNDGAGPSIWPKRDLDKSPVKIYNSTKIFFTNFSLTLIHLLQFIKLKCFRVYLRKSRTEHFTIN